MVTLQEFQKIRLIVARVVEAKVHPQADKLLILTVDTGTGTRPIVAGIRSHYDPPELLGKQIVMVENLEPATIRGVSSCGMLLAVQDGNTLSVIVPERPVSPGSVIR